MNVFVYSCGFCSSWSAVRIGPWHRFTPTCQRRCSVMCGLLGKWRLLWQRHFIAIYSSTCFRKSLTDSLECSSCGEPDISIYICKFDIREFHNYAKLYTCTQPTKYVKMKKKPCSTILYCPKLKQQRHSCPCLQQPYNENILETVMLSTPTQNNMKYK